MLSVQVCIMGAGPVGGALGCRLATAGVSVAVIDHAALPPMENPAFDGRAYAIAAGRVICWTMPDCGTCWTCHPTRSETSASPTAASAARRRACMCISITGRRRMSPVRSAGWWRRAPCARRSMHGFRNSRGFTCSRPPRPASIERSRASWFGWTTERSSRAGWSSARRAATRRCGSRPGFR